MPITTTSFTFRDLEQDCRIETNCHQLDGKYFGIKITIPEDLRSQAPYHCSAYVFLQSLRQEIFELGTIEFPDLPVNKTNHTLAQRSPKQHSYSSNPYLTDICQEPHQDTPPYPTAFWLDEPRQFSASWVISDQGLKTYSLYRRQHPTMDITEAHRTLVPESIANGTGILLNQTPGLLLIDNSEHRRLYHARTSNFDAVSQQPDHESDTAMYAFNEIGLLNYIDVLDSRRGSEYRDEKEAQGVKEFLDQENLTL